MIFFLLILIFLPVSEVKFLFTTYQNISMHVVLLSENYKTVKVYLTLRFKNASRFVTIDTCT